MSAFPDLDRCPRCGEEPTDVHVRGQQVVLVPCGHAFGGLSALDVPESEL